MKRREELEAMAVRLLAMADDDPRNISLSAAQSLTNAADAIARALDFAVDAAEAQELKNQ